MGVYTDDYSGNLLARITKKVILEVTDTSTVCLKQNR